MFTSNNTSPAEYEMAYELGAVIVFDDVRFLERAKCLPELVSFRVDTHEGSDVAGLMGGNRGTKFGVPADRCIDAYRKAIKLGAKRFGIHTMTLANELDYVKLSLALEVLIDLVRRIERELNIQIELFNLGGGIGIPYRPEDVPFDIAGYASRAEDTFKTAFGDRAIKIMTEYGRCISGPHGVLVSKVTSCCEKRTNIVGLDASMSALMRPGLYEDAYHHITLPFAENRSDVKADFVGSLCENFDRFALGRNVPRPEEGDVVVIHDTGAHGHSMGFTYNGRLRPAELMLDHDGSVLEIRRAETLNDYLATVVDRKIQEKRPNKEAESYNYVYNGRS